MTPRVGPLDYLLYAGGVLSPLRLVVSRQICFRMQRTARTNLFWAKSRGLTVLTCSSGTHVAQQGAGGRGPIGSRGRRSSRRIRAAARASAVFPCHLCRPCRPFRPFRPCRPCRLCRPFRPCRPCRPHRPIPHHRPLHSIGATFSCRFEALYSRVLSDHHTLVMDRHANDRKQRTGNVRIGCIAVRSGRSPLLLGLALPDLLRTALRRGQNLACRAAQHSTACTRGGRQPTGVEIDR